MNALFLNAVLAVTIDSDTRLIIRVAAFTAIAAVVIYWILKHKLGLTPDNYCPQTNQVVPVQTTGGSQTICAWAYFDVATLPTVVYAMVYTGTDPGAVLFPGVGGGAQQSDPPIAGKFCWPSLASAASAPTPGAANYFVVWCTATGAPTVGVTPAVLNVPFSGVTSGGYACCSGSGSTHPTAAAVHGLIGERGIHVVVSDGANQGTHLAVAAGSMQWRLTLAGTQYVIRGDSTDQLTIDGPSQSVRSRSVTANPFRAIFPGAILGGTNDIVVTRA